MKNKTCLVIIGPTAVGKTSVAIDLALHFDTEIISADSRQCYRELNIGVAKPSTEQLKLVPHHFINSHSIHEEVNAKLFEEYALQKVNDIFHKKDIAVMVGGTGLYIKAFCEGIDKVPVIDNEIKKEIISGYNENGIEWLKKEIEKNDPLFFLQGEINNPHRMLRALEVKLSTGRSILEFHLKKSSGVKAERNFNIIKIGLQLPKQDLHDNIGHRTLQMMEQGLLDESKQLYPFKNLKALQTVGYRELFEHMDGKISLDDAVKKIIVNTRQYAKRQVTWFKKDEDIRWFSPRDNLVEIITNF